MGCSRAGHKSYCDYLFPAACFAARPTVAEALELLWIVVVVVLLRAEVDLVPFDHPPLHYLVL